MSCPDWKGLTAHRFAGPDGEPPAGWAEALAHFDHCSECRDEALAADPSLLFRRMPGIAADRALVDDVRGGLETLRRVRRVDGAAAAERRSSGGEWWRRAAAAAILATALAAAGPSAAPPSRDLGAPATLGSELLGRSLEGSVGLSFTAASGEDGALDQIDRPNANVYHFDDDRVAVVMVVDAGLDV